MTLPIKDLPVNFTGKPKLGNFEEHDTVTV